MAELAAATEEDAWSDDDWRAFPPLYTLQPHAATREAQLNVWIDLLWRWCKAQNSWTVDVASCDVFVNDVINRRLDEKGRREVAKAACRAGRGELLDNGALFVLEQQPKDLARQLYDWAKATGKLGGVFTLAELEDDGPLAGADARLRTAAPCFLLSAASCSKMPPCSIWSWRAMGAACFFLAVQEISKDVIFWFGAF